MGDRACGVRAFGFGLLGSGFWVRAFGGRGLDLPAAVMAVGIELAMAAACDLVSLHWGPGNSVKLCRLL